MIPTWGLAQYCGQSSLLEYLNFSSSAVAPEKAAICPFIQGGAGMPPEVLTLFVFGPLGLALTVRVRHPAPLLVSGMLVGGVVALSAPSPGLSILALAFFVGIAGAGLWLYQRSRNTL